MWQKIKSAADGVFKIPTIKDYEDNEEKYKDMVVLKSVLQFSNYYLLIPVKDFFHYKKAILWFLTIFALYGYLFHIYANWHLNLPLVEFYEDMCAILGIASFFLMLLFQTLRPKTMIDIVSELGKYKQFGRPTDLEDRNRKIELFVWAGQIFTWVIYASYALNGINQISECNNKKEQGYKNICGSIVSRWYPINLDFSPVKELVIAVDAIFNLVFVSTGFLICCNSLAFVEHIRIKIDHLISLLSESFDDFNDEIIRLKVNTCIKYHIHIIQLINLVNDYSGIVIGIHMTFSIAMTSVALYGFLIDYSFKSVALSILVFSAVFLDCFAGQRLLNKKEELTDAIYNSKWYNGNIPIRKQILLMLHFSQQEYCLKVPGLSVMSYETFSIIVKSAYSCMTILRSIEKD